MSFGPHDVPDLHGRCALVTGANSGVGFEAAVMLAAKGARVVLGCRDPSRAERALASLRARHPQAQAELLQLDLASLRSIRAAVERLAGEHPQLDILCNNAGVMAIARAQTEDGFEMQLGVNHLGHFALTGLLLPQLLTAPAARVVTVTSLMHRAGRMRWDDLDGVRRYQRWEAYAQSKLANLAFAFELQRRLAASGTRASSVACHPGYSATHLQLAAPEAEGRAFGLAFYRTANRLFAQSAERGAWPTVYAATSPEARGGDCIGPGGPGELWGAPVRVSSPSRAARDPELAARLWSLSVERTGVSYEALSGPP
jgi:NAD(P)-dependent dehydrogenase (short-subunit alcohol dehydrogenase family)